MKIKKKQLYEVIDSNGELIGKDAVPTAGTDLETQANKTTDYNYKVGMQPFRYDMLGRFGFTLLPFFEAEEKGGEKNELIEELAKFFYEDYMAMLKHYYKNPKTLQRDYRKKSELDFDSDESTSHDYTKAKKVLDVIRPFLDKELKTLDENIREELDENAFFEGKIVEKLVDKKEETELSKKSKDNGVRDKKLEKIAGLINKLEKKDISKIINLLETE